MYKTKRLVHKEHLLIWAKQPHTHTDTNVNYNENNQYKFTKITKGDLTT